MKNFPPHLNFVAALPCEINTTMNVNVTSTLFYSVMQKHVPDFISADLWPPDLNPVNFKIWTVMQRRVYQRKIHTIDDLKHLTE